MLSERILVVDDDELWRAMCQSLLGKQGYKVTGVGDYASARDELARCFYPVVIIDVRLVDEQDTEGFRVLAEIERLWPFAEVHKIIACGRTLNPAEIEAITQATKSRSVTYLPKPKARDPLALLGVVRHAFARMHRSVHCFFSNQDCELEIEPLLNQVFVAMPYTIKSPGIVVNMDDVYTYGIKQALQELGYSAVKAADKPLIGGLICNVCRGIQESVMCIADITDWNPNVLFELGLMYGWGKLTAILKHARSNVPTDLNFALYLEYDSIASLRSQLRRLFTRLQEQQGRATLLGVVAGT